MRITDSSCGKVHWDFRDRHPYHEAKPGCSAAWSDMGEEAREDIYSWRIQKLGEVKMCERDARKRNRGLSCTGTPQFLLSSHIPMSLLILFLSVEMKSVAYSHLKSGAITTSSTMSQNNYWPLRNPISSQSPVSLSSAP